MSEDNIYKEGNEMPEGKKAGDLKSREGLEVSTEKGTRKKYDANPASKSNI